MSCSRKAHRTGKSRLIELVGDRLAVEIVHRHAAAGDCGIHVFPSEEAKEAIVAARFVGQEIGPRVRIAGADPAALATMDRETDKVSLGKVSRRQCSPAPHSMLALH